MLISVATFLRLLLLAGVVAGGLLSAVEAVAAAICKTSRVTIAGVKATCKIIAPTALVTRLPPTLDLTSLS